MSNKRELLVELTTGKTRPAVAGTPIITSAETAWQGLLLEHHHLSAFEANDVCPLNNLIFLHLTAPITLEWKRDGHFRPIQIHPTQISIIPARMGHSARTSDSGGRFLMLSLEQRLLAYAAHEFVEPDRLELELTQASNDAFIQAICLTLQAELEAGAPGGRLYSDSLATALAVHLIQKYSLHQPRTPEYRGGLGKLKLRRAIDFINEHLEQDIPLNSIASEVGMSPFHFARLFKQSTGLAPHQYVLRCRIERARRMLLRSEGSIAEIAVRVGFCDQSHLASHFKRIYSVTPKQFLRETLPRKILS